MKLRRFSIDEEYRISEADPSAPPRCTWYNVGIPALSLYEGLGLNRGADQAYGREGEISTVVSVSMDLPWSGHDTLREYCVAKLVE